MHLWSVVACDQYTAQPDYWERLEEQVGEAPSALHLILPENKLSQPDVAARIQAIDHTMAEYLDRELFRECTDGMIYVERTLSNGLIRRGLVGSIDLEAYEFAPGNQAMIRATEGTVLSRLPPRVAVRENAPLELPHVMLLMDDPQDSVMGHLAGERDRMEPVYDFDLMEQGGHVKGWLLHEEQMKHTADTMRALSDPEAFRKKYHLDGEEAPMLFAVGDGNHSLATAKACWDRLKREGAGPDHPGRYALVEVNSLHDPALDFEAIHRVMFHVDPQELLDELKRHFPSAVEGEDWGHVLNYAYGSVRGCITVTEPEAQLTVGTLQDFLDGYLEGHPQAEIDYIHGGEVALRLAEGEDAVAFLLPPMEKDELFPTVIHDGALPRKTFSMGEAQDKRFYLEARRIQP